MRRSLLVTIVAVGCVLGGGGVASAVVLNESGDAGSLPETAQETVGAVDLITGSLSGDDQDVYKICLTGSGTFSAISHPAGLHDPQLFLFDETGRGVYGNDDFASLQPQLPAGHPLTPTAAGVYYLAIASFAQQPIAGGALIFGSHTLEHFPILPPDMEGGDLPVSGWAGSQHYSGSYRIILTGTRSCLPTTKDQCTNGRWGNYGNRFKNQGQCIAFVERKAKPPAG